MMINIAFQEETNPTDAEIIAPTNPTPIYQHTHGAEYHPESIDTEQEEDDPMPTASSPEQAYFLSFS